MNKNLEYLDTLKSEYVDLNYRINNCIRSLQDFDIKRFRGDKCVYRSKSILLDELVSKIELADTDIKSTNLIKRIFMRKYKSLDDVRCFINTNKDSLNQLKKCSRCACFECSRDCSFEPCIECSFGSNLKVCNRETFNVRVFDNYIETLVKDGGSVEEKFNVLAIIEIEDNRRFAFMVNILNENDKIILECVPSKSKKGYTFKEVTDGEVFQRLVNIYEINI